MTDSVESVLQKSREEFDRIVGKVAAQNPAGLSDEWISAAWFGWKSRRTAMDPILVELRAENKKLSEILSKPDKYWLHQYRAEVAAKVVYLKRAEAAEQALRELKEQMFCRCPEPYFGAQVVATPLSCRRCNKEVVAKQALSPSPTPAPDTNTQSLCRAKPSPDSLTPQKEKN